jgi:hypothetical protein
MQMRITSWYVTLGIVGVSAIGVVACTSTTTVNNPGDDASSSDDGTTSTEPDAGTTDTGTPATDGSSIVVVDGGDGGVVCDTTGVTDMCDLCALGMCCTQENTCQTEATDGSTTECQDIFSCVQDCIAPPADSGVDAGTLDDCTTTCSASHSAGAVSDFSALSTCLATSCATQCQ